MLQLPLILYAALRKAKETFLRGDRLNTYTPTVNRAVHTELSTWIVTIGNKRMTSVAPVITYSWHTIVTSFYVTFWQQSLCFVLLGPYSNNRRERIFPEPSDFSQKGHSVKRW